MYSARGVENEAIAWRQASDLFCRCEGKQRRAKACLSWWEEIHGPRRGSAPRRAPWRSHYVAIRGPFLRDLSECAHCAARNQHATAALPLTRSPYLVVSALLMSMKVLVVSLQYVFAVTVMLTGVQGRRDSVSTISGKASE